VNLRKLIEEHKKNREANKDIIMTMITKKANPKHRSRDPAENIVYAIDPSTDTLLSYTHIHPQKTTSKPQKIQLDISLMDKIKELQLRNDWIDTHIDICSPEVPPLFTENFDYQDMRRDFLRGILESDILGKKFVCKELESAEYAARISSTRMYDVIR